MCPRCDFLELIYIFYIMLQHQKLSLNISLKAVNITEQYPATESERREQNWVLIKDGMTIVLSL